MRSFLIALPLTLLGVSATAHAATWTLDPSHSRVGFSVSHLMVSSVQGSFTGVDGTLELEPGQLEDLTVSVTVDLTTVDTRNADRDAHLKSSDFFDMERFPSMTFQSTGVKVRKGGSFVLKGDLTLKGVTKSISLKGKGLDATVTDPWGNTRVGASATATIDRQDFGVSWNQALEAGGVLVGDEVTIQIDAEFIRKAE